MELKFSPTAVNCMECLVSECQHQEQTQEIRLPDGMPDIGRILGCWGQPLIRGKEWRTGSISVSGGVMGWILYAPEDGSGLRCVDMWIPFQMKWDIPESQQDGVIHVVPYLRGMDARSTSARKIMVRATVSVCADALLRKQTQVFLPEEVPADIQLLRETYPMEVALEAGEKSFQMDEDVLIPGNFPEVSKIVRYELVPEIMEQKVMASRLVFRGACKLHMLYASEDGMLHSWSYDIPFSQFADLDGEYGTNASGQFAVVAAGMELEKMEDGKLLLKCTLIAQYLVYDRVMVDVVEDAYSPTRALKIKNETLQLPVRLDTRAEQISYTKTAQLQGQNVVDCSVFWDNGPVRQNGDTLQMEIQTQHNVLAYDENGVLQSASLRGAEEWNLTSDSGNTVKLQTSAGNVQAVPTGDAVELSGSLQLDVSVFCQRGINMVTCLEIGEALQADPERPALILRRAGEKRLWDIAKECGSTVDAICSANHLQQEPVHDQMLLIPVL